MELFVETEMKKDVLKPFLSIACCNLICLKMCLLHSLQS